MKSIGHLAFNNEKEWYTRKGDLILAPTSSPIDTMGIRPGRWECPLEHAIRYPGVYPWLAQLLDLNQGDRDICRIPAREAHLEVTWRIVGGEYVNHVYNRQAQGYSFGLYTTDPEQAALHFRGRCRDYC